MFECSRLIVFLAIKGENDIGYCSRDNLHFGQHINDFSLSNIK